jgi:hypothetical protein
MPVFEINTVASGDLLGSVRCPFDCMDHDDAIAVALGGALAENILLGRHVLPSPDDSKLVREAVAKGGDESRGRELAGQRIRQNTNLIKHVAAAVSYGAKLNSLESKRLFERFKHITN